MPLLALSACLTTGTLLAGELPQAYFEPTAPGSWAKYETTTADGSKTAATYTRLADESGGLAVEILTEFVSGPNSGNESKSIFKLDPHFDWQRRFLSFGKALTGATFVMEGRPPLAQPEQMVQAMRDAMAEFSSFESAGSATDDGVTCDLYEFQAVLGGPNPGTMTGKVCLSRSVPFGLVYQETTSRNERSGESSFETRLVDSGSGAVRNYPKPKVASTATATAQRLNIALAYQRGSIALNFRVRANTGGRAFGVTLTNLTDQPLVIGVGKTTYAFEVGFPIGRLYFQPVYEGDVALDSGETSDEFHAGQIADKGVREGSFRLVMKRGKPTLSGEYKVGKIK